MQTSSHFAIPLDTKTAASQVLPHRPWRDAPPSRPPLAFLFSGIGGQWPAMGASLARLGAAREAMEACDAALVRQGVPSVLPLLLSEREGEALRRTDRAQAALFTLQVAQVAQWRALGVEPDVVVGFSLGEVAAAWAAGVHDLDDAARVIAACRRGAHAVPPRGRMLACALDSTHAARLATDGVQVAAHNGPRGCVLAGPEPAVSRTARALEEAGVWHRLLEVSHPFHTEGMAPASAVMQRALADLRPAVGRVPLCSTVTGELVHGLHDASYWAHSVQAPVRFEAAVRTLVARGVRVVVQLGAHPDLERSLISCASDAAITVVASQRRHQPAAALLLDGLTRLRALGSAPAPVEPR